ncbi:MAG: M56 family metallopeptidase [Gemmatimonadaceae bacterium]
MLCILYVIAVGTVLGIVGLLVERALPPTAARRWVWCAIIATSLIVPGFYRANHNFSITEVFEQQAAHPPGHALASAALTALDPAWWARVQSLDTQINRIWVTVSWLLIVWGLANAGRVYRVVSVSRRQQAARHAPTIVDGVPVVITDSIGPATVGFWRSRVLVPRWVLALPGVQRQYVLRHEEEHRSANDARLLLVASLTLLLVPWNLALWWQLWRLRLAVEIDCDNRVVAALGDANAYGGLLLKVAEASSRGPRLQPAFLGGMGSLERRLAALLAPTPLRHAQRFLVPAMAIALLFAVLSMPHPVLGGESMSHHPTSATPTAIAVSTKPLPATESLAANRP